MGLKKTDQEIYDYLKTFLSEERVRKMEHFSYSSSDFVLPVMEDVYQFRNAAAIIRSAEACGFHKVVALESRNVFDPNLEVTKGAETWVEVQKMSYSLDSIAAIKSEGYKIVAVSPEKNASYLTDFKIEEKTALLFGTEWNGVSDDFLNFCDETLAIPMYGFTQSYNVSVAAAICMYDLKQKLIASQTPHFISAEDRLKLLVRWAKNSIKSGDQILNQFLQS